MSGFLGAIQSRHLAHGQNVRVTISQPNEARSESAIAINPSDPSNMVCASKRFYDRANYMSTIGVSYTNDGGVSWHAANLPPFPGHPEFTWLVDPDVTFDSNGNAWLWTEPVGNPPRLSTLAMIVYRSQDGGQTWSGEAVVHTDPADDKGWIEADTGQNRLYAFWGANTPLRFAASRDGGLTWQGVGGGAAGTNVEVAGSNGLDSVAYAPATAISPDGTLHVTWNVPGSSDIVYTRSHDGGQTFEPFRAIVSNVVSLSSVLGELQNWPVLPGATFRVLTMATIATDATGRIAIAWSDAREGVARVYMALSLDGGNTWPPALTSIPLIPGFPSGQLHHCFPQLAAAGNAVIGCAFYEYNPSGEPPAIDVRITALYPGDTSFVFPVTITDNPWDPTISPPIVHNTTDVTFIGDYFGIAAGRDFFQIVWTDTRTGLQELWSATVTTMRSISVVPPGIIAQIIAGVIQDGGGLVFVGGHIVRIPPWDPGMDVLNALGALSFARNISGAAGRNAIAALWRTIGTIAEQNIGKV
jgi:hypothetical protein